MTTTSTLDIERQIELRTNELVRAPAGGVGLGEDVR